MRLRLTLAAYLLTATACGVQHNDESSLAGNRNNLRANQAEGRFPTHPDEKLTPGELCQDPDYRRHPEKIAYCERDVDSDTKKDIIRQYDQELGFEIGSMNRGDFKIDHFIPLCIGGGNSRANLWPQHKTVYDKTDIIEDQTCRLLQRALMKQAELIEIVRHVKFNLDEADQVSADLERKLGGNR